LDRQLKAQAMAFEQEAAAKTNDERRESGGNAGKPAEPDPMSDPYSLIPKHGGYRKLKSFQIAQLVYDLTIRFCNHYVDKRSRTHDQMVQAARSGVQNIAEGSQASGTSKKTEMKLTNVARASLEELRLDYEDFLRQRGLPLWERSDPRRGALISIKPSTEQDVAIWARAVYRESRVGRHGQSGHNGQSGPADSDSLLVPSTVSTSSTLSMPVGYPEILANAVLALLAASCSLLDRQLKAQAMAFEREGGFTERLYGRRQNQRRT
jgi:four helix bundle suffix protein